MRVMRVLDDVAEDFEMLTYPYTKARANSHETQLRGGWRLLSCDRNQTKRLSELKPEVR